jgi:hypothetical protein
MKNSAAESRLWLSLAVLCCAAGCSLNAKKDTWPQYAENPFVIRLGIPVPTDDRGGITVADLDGDGLMDYLVTVPGHVAAYAHDGRQMWVLETEVLLSLDEEKWGLPGQQAPGLQAADVDGDRRVEVLYMTREHTSHVVDGATGGLKWTAKPPSPPESDGWEHQVVGNFRGLGDRDILLQTTNTTGYRMGRYLAAFAAEDLRAGRFQPLWQRDDFLACAHTAVRLADLDGDGRDEVLGGTILGRDGKILYKLPLTGHIDAIAVDDIRPDIPGLEVVAAEEGDMRFPDRDRVLLYNKEQLIWQNHRNHQESQDLAVGDFDPDRPGLESFCRHRGNGHQEPWVFDAGGAIIADYKLDAVAPPGWEPAGIEVVQTIHWTGGPKPLLAAKERHRNGHVAILDAMTGRFVRNIKEQACRLFVADVSGDWREEMVVLSGSQTSELHVYHNDEPNPDPGRARLWTFQHYRRCKMTWNYSSQ